VVRIARDQCFRAAGNGHFYEWQVRWIRKRIGPKSSRYDAHPGHFQIVQECVDLRNVETESGSTQDFEVLIENSIIKGHLERVGENEVDDAPRWPMRTDQARNKDDGVYDDSHLLAP